MVSRNVSNKLSNFQNAFQFVTPKKANIIPKPKKSILIKYDPLYMHIYFCLFVVIFMVSYKVQGSD